MWISELRYQDPRTETYLGSPSIVRLPDGALLGSHDHFGTGCPLNMENEEHLTAVYRSEDDGLTWRNVTYVSGQYWSSLFVHEGAVYILGTTAQYGGICIRRSDDGGYTWTNPADEETGALFPGGAYHDPPNYHCSAVPVFLHNGRLYRAFEDDCVQDHHRDFLSCVISAPADADLLKASNWTMSNKLKFEHDKAASYPERACWLEGNVVADRDGQLWNVLRFNGENVVNTAAFVKITDEGRTQSFDYETGFVQLPGAASKFTIRYDEPSGLYWTLANDQEAGPARLPRNSMSIYTSPDLREWTHRKRLLWDNLEGDPEKSAQNTGFQYVDWIFDPADDDTILYLSRTAYDGAHNYHDSNRITFSRVRDFRKLVE